MLIEEKKTEKPLVLQPYSKTNRIQKTRRDQRSKEGPKAQKGTMITRN